MRKQAAKAPMDAETDIDPDTAKKKRKQARRLKVDLTKSVVSSADPNTLDPNAPVSDNWQDLLNQADSVDQSLD
ncbi:MAG: hypothetical protein ABJG80_20915 [Paracoccaceae bacterium]